MTIRRPSGIASIILFMTLMVVFSNLTVTSTAQNDLEWPKITRQTKPWTRWWWLGSIVNKQDLTTEMEKYQKAGLGGLEITPIYGVKGLESRFINYLSPQWMDMFEHTLEEADRLGMGIDMATGNGWPFGGIWVGEDIACRNFIQKEWSLKSGERLTDPIAAIQKPLVRAVGKRLTIDQVKDPISSNTNLQEMALDQVRFEKPLPLVALMAFSDSGQKLNLTSKVGTDKKLDWTAPAGEWKLYALFQGWHGKMVERAGPGGEGNVIDHFSAASLRKYLERFDQAFAGRTTKSLRGFFNDSYEVDDAEGESNWTPNFLAEFRRRRGYDLIDQLPALAGKSDADTNSRVLCDFRETISDLLLDEFTIPWREWAHTKGAIIRNQAHGSPANILDLYAASDIPETEGQEIMRMKFASSAAHVTGKQLASSEAATWLNEHTLATLAEVKQAVDKFFLGGVNHICYHGTPFSPESEPWPGFLFYAAVHFGTTNPFWDDFGKLNEYVARCQSFLQAGKPDNDVLLYYPIHDDWSKPSRELLNHYGGGISSELGQSDAKALIDAGYSYDLISDRQLASLAVTSSGQIAAGGAFYKAIVLPEIKVMPPASLTKVTELAQQGATVVVRGKLPSDVPGLANLTQRRAELSKSTAKLRFTPISGASVGRAPIGKGRFLLGPDVVSILNQTTIVPETITSRGFQYIRRKDGDSTIYFISNPTSTRFSGWVLLNADSRSAAIFDAMTGESGTAATVAGKSGGTQIHLQILPGQSLIVKTFARTIQGRPYQYFTRTSDAGIPVAGKWSVRFEKGGPSLPATTEVNKLGSWTGFGGEEFSSFSGTAIYSTRFARPQQKADAWLLDLGQVAETARVTVNGRSLGTLLLPPYEILVPADLLRDENTLEIAVTSLMTNRVIDLDRRKVNWKRFYNVNMPARRRENGGPDGLFNAASWNPRDSGLIGPVVLLPGSLAP